MDRYKKAIEWWKNLPDFGKIAVYDLYNPFIEKKIRKNKCK